MTDRISLQNQGLGSNLVRNPFYQKIASVRVDPNDSSDERELFGANAEITPYTSDPTAVV